MILSNAYPGGIWLCDFEFHPPNGGGSNHGVPLCMFALDITSGEQMHIWQDELRQLCESPFPTDASTLFVAYDASIGLGGFLNLGWCLPVNVLDLFTEFRCLTNGITLPHGSNLLGAFIYFGISGISSIDNCESNVHSLAKLLTSMLSEIDLDRALLRGEYMTSIARIESIGVPIDLTLLQLLMSNWNSVQDSLVSSVDQTFGVFKGRSFSSVRFQQYLSMSNVHWPYLPNGSLDLSDETFRKMARIYPEIEPLRELRVLLSNMRLENLSVDNNSRNRCMLSPFHSKTGRNQPSNSKFIFGPSVWLRGLIKPAPGYGLAHIDWEQQEFGIAGALSGDLNMMEAYSSGDPYLTFAIQAGAVPSYATKHSHQLERDQFKLCVLAVQYGMGPDSLAILIKQPVARARQLLDLHRRTYQNFWIWSDQCLNEAILSGRLWTNFGWQIQVEKNPNERSLRNFPMQAHGAEMLRISCILLTRACIRICATVHDSILIEAPLDQLDAAVETTTFLMREASRIVLSGFELSSEAKIVRYPDRYMDARGQAMWNKVMELLNEPQYQ